VAAVVAFAERVGRPVCLLGESGGGTVEDGTTARSEARAAVDVYKPTVFEAADEDTAAKLGATLEQVGALAADGRLGDALSTLVRTLANDDECTTLLQAADSEDATQYVPAFLQDVQQSTETGGPSPTDPSVLERIAVPVLLMRGTRTALPWLADGVNFAAEHVAGARVVSVPGAGHFAPGLMPEPIADEVARHFAWVAAPA
jgi:pimeloyl-ACP methyl ester carboxylesterase